MPRTVLINKQSSRKARNENDEQISEHQSMHSVSQPSLCSNKSKKGNYSCRDDNQSLRSYSSYRSQHMKSPSKPTESQKLIKTDKQKYLSKKEPSSRINVNNKPQDLSRKELINNREIATARFDYPSLNSK